MFKISKQIQDILNQPVSVNAIVFFRIAFGLMVVLEICHYTFGRTDIADFYLDPSFHFKYFGFGWLPTLSGMGIKIFLGLLCTCFVLFALGFLYRITSILSCIGFGYLLLLERSFFLNHWYFIFLLSFLMIFIPAHRAFSVDAWLKPAIKRDHFPAWCLYILLFQTGVVYFFAGLSKLNPDWLAGQPLGILLLENAHKFPTFLAQLFNSYAFILFSAISIALFELMVVPLLIWKKSRKIAIILAITFHLLNNLLFPIGYFPKIMILMTLLFLGADFPLNLWSKWRKKAPQKPPSTIQSSRPRWLFPLLGIFIIVQCIMPLRHYLYAGNRLWAEKGLLFSWHMMTKYKGGSIQYLVVYRKGKFKDVVYPEKMDLTWGQARKLHRHPDLILQYAHHLGKIYRQKREYEVEIYADAFLHLNGRPQQRFIHPNVDLLKQKQTLIAPYWWVIPLQE